MDDLHTLAVEVARRIMETGDAEGENLAVAKMLLDALANLPQPPNPDPEPQPQPSS